MYADDSGFRQLKDSWQRAQSMPSTRCPALKAQRRGLGEKDFAALNEVFRVDGPGR